MENRRKEMLKVVENAKFDVGHIDVKIAINKAPNNEILTAIENSRGYQLAKRNQEKGAVKMENVKIYNNLEDLINKKSEGENKEEIANHYYSSMWFLDGDTTIYEINEGGEESFSNDIDGPYELVHGYEEQLAADPYEEITSDGTTEFYNVIVESSDVTDVNLTKTYSSALEIAKKLSITTKNNVLIDKLVTLENGKYETIETNVYKA